MALVSGDLWLNRETKQFSRLFAELTQIYFEKSGTSLRLDALVAYHVHVVWWNFPERKRKDLLDHGYTSLGTLLVRAAELAVENAEFEEDESVLLYGLTSSDEVSLKELMPQTF